MADPIHKGKSKPVKPSRKDPYAAIEHRVIESPAYADLSFSSCALLILLARQLSKDNNGHLQASFKWCHQRGFGSEHTLSNAIAELISHGFIYRTRSHGANKAWARYAVTWLPIKQRDGLFLAGFTPCAWREWNMPNDKSTPQKVQDQSSRKCSFTPDNPAESAGCRGAKNADYELIPRREQITGVAVGGDTDLTTPDSGIAQGDFQRISDNAFSSDCWDVDSGAYVAPPPKQRMVIL